MGHCIDYNFVCEIETAQAEAALKQLEAEVIEGELPDQTQSSKQVTYWWADNFNQIIETQTGHGAIDSTHVVEFSEEATSSSDVQVCLCNVYILQIIAFWNKLYFYKNICDILVT